MGFTASAIMRSLNTYAVGVTFVIFVIAIVARGRFDSMGICYSRPSVHDNIHNNVRICCTVNFEAWGTFVLALMIFVLMFFRCMCRINQWWRQDRPYNIFGKNIRNELDRCVSSTQ